MCNMLVLILSLNSHALCVCQNSMLMGHYTLYANRIARMGGQIVHINLICFF